MPDNSATNWLALCYALGTLPSRNRVFVWRRLKEIGAVYVRQSVAALPESDYLLAYFEELRTKIVKFGGKASLIRMTFLDPEDEREVTELYNENIRRDYGTVERMLIGLATELEGITREKEVNRESMLAALGEINKSRRAFEKVALRDYFGTSYGDKAEKIIASAAAMINEFKHRTEDATA
jgi:hypothetical protein